MYCCNVQLYSIWFNVQYVQYKSKWNWFEINFASAHKTKLINLRYVLHWHMFQNCFVLSCHMFQNCFVLNWHMFQIILYRCRNLITKMKENSLHQYIPLDSHLQFHKICACTALFFSVLHTVGHLVSDTSFFKQVQYSGLEDKLCVI